MSVGCAIEKLENVLSPVTVILLQYHDFLGNNVNLLQRYEANSASRARERLLVSVCDTHATSDRHVEAS